MTKHYFNKKYKKNLNKYYLATPKSYELFVKLYKKIKKFENPKKYNELIDDVLDHYQNLEVGSILMRNKSQDEKLIRSVIKEQRKGRRVSEEDISWIKNNVEKHLNKKKFKEVKFKVPVKKILVSGKEYFFVNDELIPISKIEKFMEILKMDVYMKLVAYAKDLPPQADNRKHAVIPAIKAMSKLFIEIVKDSQVKV